MKDHIARVAFREQGKTQYIIIRYNDYFDLLKSVYDFESDKRYRNNVFLVTDVANNLVLQWDSTMAHYCFTKGRISVNDLYTHLRHVNRSRPIHKL